MLSHSLEAGLVASSVEMPTKQVSVPRGQCFNPAVLRMYRYTIPSNENKSKVERVKVLGLVSGRRSYECKVVPIPD
jgi:hypothetical protein